MRGSKAPTSTYAIAWAGRRVQCVPMLTRTNFKVYGFNLCCCIESELCSQTCCCLTQLGMVGKMCWEHFFSLVTDCKQVLPKRDYMLRLQPITFLHRKIKFRELLKRKRQTFDSRTFKHCSTKWKMVGWLLLLVEFDNKLGNICCFKEEALKELEKLNFLRTWWNHSANHLR